MIIKTAKLKELVDEALRQDRVRWDQEEEEFVARLKEHRDQWIADYAEAWVDASFEIRRKLSNDEPITRDDVPQVGKSHWRDPAFYTPPSPGSRHEKSIVAGKSVYAPPRDLVQFQLFLETVDGDTITTSALRDHGFQNLQNRILQFIHEAIER